MIHSVRLNRNFPMDVPLRQHAKSTTKGESLNSKNWIGDGEKERGRAAGAR